MTDKAFLCGINKYPGAPLAGCVNDVQDMANYLVKNQGFSPSSIRLLVDERATTQNILDRLNWLIDVKPGDRCLFHYSGHGAQVATRNHAQEVDGLDEVACPVDFDWTDVHMIRDKQFHALFAKVPAGVKFNWISDSCHSGDLLRGFNLGSSRHYPVPADITWRNDIARNKSYKAAGMGNPTSPLNVGYISGCKSNQTSADANFNGRANGAATYFILKVLQAHPTAALTEIVKLANAELASNHYTQHPQAEGLRITNGFLL